MMDAVGIKIIKNIIFQDRFGPIEKFIRFSKFHIVSNERAGAIDG